MVMSRELSLRQVKKIVDQIEKNKLKGLPVIWWKSRFLGMVPCAWQFLESAT